MSFRRHSPALLAGLCLISACGSTKRVFDSFDAGDSGASGMGADSGAGAGGTVANAGGRANGTGGTAGGKGGASGGKGGATGSGGDAAAGGTGEGGSGEPACGAPGTPCCAGDTCDTGASCQAGSCSCDAQLSACSASCVDLEADPKNCGSCGHDCLGGDCDLGSCQPLNVVTAQSRFSQMATDGTFIYWSGADAAGTHYYVNRRRVDGSDAVKPLASAEAGASGLAITPSSVYWLAAGHLRVCDAPDCSRGPADYVATVTAPNCGASLLYTAPHDTLYWSCSADYNDQNGTLWSLPLQTVNPVATIPSPANPLALAGDSANLYWMNSATYTADNLNHDGALSRIRLSDGLKTTLATGIQADLYSFAVGGSWLYYAGNIINAANAADHNAIFQVPLPNGLGGAAAPKFANASSPSASIYAMVADAQHLYYVDMDTSGAANIKRCAHAGCPAPETVAPSENNTTAMTQDSVSIYWGTRTTFNNPATIRRLAK